MFRTLFDLLSYAAVRVFICTVQALPLATCVTIVRAIARVLTSVIPLRRKVADENLRLAYPEMSEADRRKLIRRMWEHLLLLVVETSHCQRKLHETNWRQFITMRGARQLCRILLGDQATLLISAHFGNFEVGGAMMGILGFETYSVARTLDNPYLAEFVNQARSEGRQHVIPKKGGYEQILAVLSRGGTMGFLADQYAGTKGCWVNFFGRPASAHKAIALFALDNQATMVCCYCRRMERPMLFEMGVAGVYDPRSAVDESTTPKQLTQWFTNELEAMVRMNPEQYWWVHRRWRDNRPAHRRKAV
ncbi:MAG: lysophospholipid acyltransferase family protein [Planctomycetes bacterium]|nr:lysophospholipid acyltransferase family protein [Planctomycetota bacterium]